MPESDCCCQHLLFSLRSPGGFLSRILMPRRWFLLLFNCGLLQHPQRRAGAARSSAMPTALVATIDPNSNLHWSHSQTYAVHVIRMGGSISVLVLMGQLARPTCWPNMPRLCAGNKALAETTRPNGTESTPTGNLVTGWATKIRPSMFTTKKVPKSIESSEMG